MSISSLEIKKSIQKFLQSNNLLQSLHIFKNQSSHQKQKMRVSTSPDKQLKQLICINKKQAYQIQKLSNQIIEFRNPQIQNQLRQYLQRTEVKVLKKVFERIKKATRKWKSQTSETVMQSKLVKMKFMGGLLDKQKQNYEELRLEQKLKKNNSPLLEQSRQYQNEWQNPNQMGYEVNQFSSKQFGQVCKQLKALRTSDSLNQIVKFAPFPEAYYSQISEYKQRNNLNIHDKFYSRLPSHMKFISDSTVADPRIPAKQKAQDQSSDDENTNLHVYPIQMNNIVYDSYDLKIIYDRDKTGFQEQRDIKIVINQVLAGRYQIISNLGQAQFSNAIEVKDLTSQKRYCLKIIQNNKEYFDQSIDEIKILRFIKANCNPDEKCLLNLHDYFYHKQHLMLLTQLLKDTLFHAYQMNRQMFSNLRNLQIITRQILIGLQKLHELHIAHTDLKPQNIMIKSYTNKTVKVIDLGSSVFFHDEPTYYIQTRSYRAPQVILGIPYDGKIDIWSLGCIVAQVFTGEVLFEAQTEAGMLAMIQGLRGPWPSWMVEKGLKAYDYFTKDMFIYQQMRDANKNKIGKSRIYTPKITNMKSRIGSQNRNFLDFLSKCLKIDPAQRISASQALGHPFITQAITE